MLFSEIIPSSPSPTISKSMFFVSVSPLLSCNISTLSRFHAYALILFDCVFLTYFTLYNKLQVHPPH